MTSTNHTTSSDDSLIPAQWTAKSFVNTNKTSFCRPYFISRFLYVSL